MCSCNLGNFHVINYYTHCSVDLLHLYSFGECRRYIVHAIIYMIQYCVPGCEWTVAGNGRLCKSKGPGSRWGSSC